MGQAARQLSVFSLTLGALVTVQSATAGDVWHVDDDAVGTTCASWADACADLQSALDLAQPGDEIWVAMGTYRPDRGTGDRKGTFQLISGVAIYGGFATAETERDQRDPSANITTLTGDLIGNDGPGFTGSDENSYHVVTGGGADATAVLDGFEVTGGNANSTFGGSNSSGGGLHIDQGSPSIIGCAFVDNQADFGGAMYNADGLTTLINCRFVGNSATFGGAIHNQPSKVGGAAPTLINCTFCNNTADLGGAMANWNGASPTITNCTFTQNTAIDTGGAIANVDSDAVITNTIIWGNSDSGGQGQSAQIQTIAGSPTVSNSCIQSGWTGIGTDNISDDPMFAGVGCEDLHLQSGSPCIDAGDNSAVTFSWDLDGNPRIVGGAVDIGAYEYFDPTPTLVTSDPADGYIDPRTAGTVELPLGLDEITLTFDAPTRNADGSPLSIAAFDITSTGDNPPTVSAIDTTGSPTVVVILSGPLEPGHWTMLTASVEGLSGVETTVVIDIGFLPGDVNQSGNVNISDATAFVTEFNGPQRIKLIDLNRSGNVNISDATAFVTIFNGGASGTALPPRP